MKTFEDLENWVEGATRELGDPAAPVGQAFFRWQKKFYKNPHGALFWTLVDGEVALPLRRGLPLVPLRIAPDGPRISAEGSLEAFGAELITAGVWALTPSLNIPGVLHIFVVLYDVPDPAPWERRIVIAR